MCHEASIAPASAAEEHSCCKDKGTVSRSCPEADAGVAVSKGRKCCGVMTESMPATISSFLILGNDERVPVKAIFVSWVGSSYRDLHAIHLLQANRAPPYIRGLGSNKTYLFKRTLLI